MNNNNIDGEKRDLYFNNKNDKKDGKIQIHF